ncbi:glycosyltransferase family 2 protein [Terrabacter sp. Root181]|uniref:glycosyltransferase family 2 protein n=1 Tax=Terrabacter sp. Root181 TaxID=1736484 RepID=UPI0006FF51C9|nr:glycosyl transferase family 2 [Terrabacter sp. Root181]
MRRTLVVVPAFNEEAAIGGVLQEIRSALPHCDVVVVDDGSTDTTSQVAAEHATVARLPFNLGVGGAMRTGFKYAALHGYDAVVQIDADGQHDPRQAAALLAQLDVTDVVIGSRFGPDSDYLVPRHRKAAMRLLATVVSRVAMTPLTDATSGFRAHSRRAIHVFAQHYPCEYLGDTVESLAIARKSGLSVSEVSVTMRARVTGRASQGSVSSTRYVARVLLTTALGVVRRWPVTGQLPS